MCDSVCMFVCRYQGGGGGGWREWVTFCYQTVWNRCLLIQNTQEIKRTLFNWTNQDKTCKFSRKMNIEFCPGAEIVLFTTACPIYYRLRITILTWRRSLICEFIYQLSFCQILTAGSFNILAQQLLKANLCLCLLVCWCSLSLPWFSSFLSKSLPGLLIQQRRLKKKKNTCEPVPCV